MVKAPGTLTAWGHRCWGYPTTIAAPPAPGWSSAGCRSGARCWPSRATEGGMPDAPDQPPGREDALNRVLADCLDALGRGEAPDLSAWQARYPAFAAELADLFAARAQ